MCLETAGKYGPQTAALGGDEGLRCGSCKSACLKLVMPWVPSLAPCKLGMLSPVCYLSIWEAEAAGFEVQGHPWVQRKTKMGQM